MHKSLRRAFVVLLVACALVAAVPSAAFAKRTVGISASTFDLSLGAGQTGSGELFVLNNGDEDINVLIYAADQLIASDGKVSYQVPDRSDLDLSRSPASWLSTNIGAETKTIGNIPYVTMKPGDQIPVQFDVTVPANAAPGDHEVILFFEMTGTPGESGSSTAVSGRVGARVNVRVAGDLVERIEVQPFVARAVMLGKINPYTFVVRNLGNVDKDIDVRLVLVNGNLEELYSSDVATQTPVYAQSNHEFTGTLETDKQLFGKYTLRLELTYPKEGGAAPEVLKLDKTVWIFPLWLVIAIIAVLGLAAVFASWRNAQAKAKKRAAARREERRRHLEETARRSAE